MTGGSPPVKIDIGESPRLRLAAVCDTPVGGGGGGGGAYYGGSERTGRKQKFISSQNNN